MTPANDNRHPDRPYGWPARDWALALLVTGVFLWGFVAALWP